MNVLLIGGAGFIGTNLIYRLCQEGYNITIYDRKFEEKQMPNNITNIIEGDFLTESRFGDIVKNQDVIIHLISTVSPSSSMLDSVSSYKNDVVKTIELLEKARDNNVKKVVFLSSGGTVYGDYPHLELLNEDLNSYPLNHYGIMKLTIEKILLMFNQLHGMENVILRVANPYGPGQDPEKKIGAVSVFLDNILKRNSLTLYGDGSTVRDYIEVSDVCEAVLCAINYRPVKTLIHPVFNVGTGVGTSIIDIIRTIESLTGVTAEIKYEKMRGIDVSKNVLDPRRSREYLNFGYKINLAEGIKILLNKWASSDGN